ncbi:MAG: hypothetical protein JWP88_1110 [Flaviaesturariibacter sp.]|nr:hypothetical protein [Flaviaesturariibacter sp.]
MKTLLFPLLLLLSAVSCRKSDCFSPRGIYTETAPIAGRTQLNFVSGSVVVKSERGSTIKDGYNYVIANGKITLLPIENNSWGSAELEFEEKGDNELRIENLYPSIPEAPRSYMSFKK